jgi:hypothetical protein
MRKAPTADANSRRVLEVNQGGLVLVGWRTLEPPEPHSGGRWLRSVRAQKPFLKFFGRSLGRDAESCLLLADCARVGVEDSGAPAFDEPAPRLDSVSIPADVGEADRVLAPPVLLCSIHRTQGREPSAVDAFRPGPSLWRKSRAWDAASVVSRLNSHGAADAIADFGEREHWFRCRGGRRATRS